MKTRFFYLGLFTLFWAGFALAATSQFVFTTEQQTILPSEISGAITIQSQDAGGNKANTTETIDLEFSSTSSTGEFLNSSGNPASAVMAKNTANRTFYYRDSTAGTYTLTIRLVGRESGQSWQASQQVVVVNTEEASQQQNQNQYSSETQSPAPVANAPKVEFGAKILGGDRVVVVGAGTNFEGAVFDSSGKLVASDDFLWSFGDGAYARGRFANHAYNYPGKYIIFFNAAVSGVSFGDSITANVIPNEVKISEVKPNDDGWVEIVNGSDFKIDISHWAVSNGREAFYFPKNTLVDAKTYLIIPEEISGIEFFPSGSAALLYPRGDVTHEIAYGGVLKSDESFHSAENTSKIGIESPGSGRFTARVSIPGARTSPTGGQSPALSISDVRGEADKEEVAENQLAAVAAVGDRAEKNSWNRAWVWFGGALVLGILSAVGYLFIKRKSTF